MSQAKRRKAQPKQKSRTWLILVVVVMMLALAGGMMARSLLPNGIDLSTLNIPLPQLPASNADVVSQAAAAYGQNNDLDQARKALAGMDNTEVAKQLTTLELNATDTVTRQNVSRLRRALGLSVVEPSAVDLVLGQQTIWVTSAIATLPFLAALALGLGSSVRTMVKTRLEEAREARAFKAGRAPARVVEVIAEEPITSEAAEAQAAQAVQAAAAAQSGGTAATTGGAAKVDKPAETKKLSLSADPMSSGDEVPAAIQGILSDVFGDETQQTRRTVLMQGLEDVPASNLLALCRQVADGLRLNRAGYGRRPGPLPGSLTSSLSSSDTL